MKGLEEILLPEKIKQNGHTPQQWVDGYNTCLADVLYKLNSLSPVRVYGDNNEAWDKNKDVYFMGKPPTHQAYLICIEPVAKGVTKEEIVEAFKAVKQVLNQNRLVNWETIKELADRIEKFGIKND